MPRRLLLVLAFYTLVAIVSTYPLIINLSIAAPAGEAWSYDGFSMLWNLWWFKHALLDLNANPFATNAIFAPLGVSLYLHTFTLFSDLVALPLLAFLSPVTASNLILIASQALCGYGMYLLSKFEIVNLKLKIEWPAILAGLAYAVTTSRFLFLAQGHYNFFMTQWLPFYLLYLLMAIQRPTRRAIFMASLFLVLTLLVELSLGVMLILLTGLYWVLQLFARPRRPVIASESTSTLRRSSGKQSPSSEPGIASSQSTLLAMTAGAQNSKSSLRAFAPLRWKFVPSLLSISAIMLTALVLASPYLLPTLRESFDPRYIPQYWGGAPVLSADLVGLFTPGTLSTFLGTHDWPREALDALQNRSRFVGINIFVIGYGVLALALLGAVVAKRARIWFWLALALVVLSLGPILHINGQSEFDLDGMKVIVGLPYIVLHYIPVLSGLRAPHRFSVVAMIPLALLVGHATAWLTNKFVTTTGPHPLVTNLFVTITCVRSVFPRLLVPLVLLVTFLALFEHISLPLPLIDATVPSIYQRIAQEPGDFTIMDVPLGWRSGFGPVGTENTQLQYYQVVHGKRLISGFAARTPAFLFDYFERQPILNGLATLESEGKLPAGSAYHDKALAAGLAYFFDLRYILIHPPAASATPYDTTQKRVADYVRELFDIDEVAQADGITVYRVNQPPVSNSLMIDFGSETSNLNRAEGWGGNEMIAGATANWMNEPDARVFAPLRTAGRYRLTLRAAPFAYPGHPPQMLSVRVNGQAPGAPQAMADGWGEYAFDLAPGVILPGLNEIVVTASAAASPAVVLSGSTDARKLSVAVDWMKVELQ